MDTSHGSEPIEFSEAWPELSGRLRRVLRSRRVPIDFVDDLVQETGLRLYRNWDRVDPSTLWALANTIAVNLVRDEMRKLEVREREAATGYGEPVRSFDDEMVTRLELRRVEKALQKMRPLDRKILLAEWGVATDVAFTSPAALKMARMRARKRLVAALERASALLPLWKVRDGLLNRYRTITAVSEQLSHVALAMLTVAAGAGLVATAQESINAAPGGAPTALAGFGDSGSRPEQWSDAREGNSFAGLTSLVTPARSGGSSAGGSTVASPEDTDLNENFGPIRSEDGRVVIGEGSGLGPYGVDEGVETSATGDRSSARARATYEAPKCDGKIMIGGNTTYKCDGAGKASADAEAEAHGQHHHVGTRRPRQGN